jgi:long-chain acyl-CoA synthetase
MPELTVREHHGVLTTVGMLRYSAERTPNTVALRIFRNGTYEEITYQQFADKVDQLAAGLINLGVTPGEHVSVLGENRPEWAIAYMAVHRAGAVAVPLDSLLKAGEFRHIIGDAGVKRVIVSGRYIPDILEVRDALGEPTTIICMDDDRGGIDDPAGILAMSEVMTTELPADFPALTLDNLAAIIYTSGTTGQSKGVMLSQGNIGSDVAGAFQSIEYDESDNFLSVLPLHHTFECTGGFLVPVYGGSSITYARSLKSRDIIEDTKNTGATLMLGVPLLFEKMMQGIQRKLGQQPGAKRALISTLFGIEKAGSKIGLSLGGKLFHSLREKSGLGTLRMMLSGGAALPPHVADWFASLGFILFQGYGLTETSPVTNVNRIGILDSACVGPPIPNAEIRIDKPGEDGHGEICVRGPMVMLGYYKNEEATREIMDDDGWLHTGDIGYEDDLDRLYISGRSKNVIVSTSGKNIYPEEVEHHINQSPHVLESLVIGRPIEGTTSEEVYAMVVPDYEHFDELGDDRGTEYSTEEIEETVRAAVHEAISHIGDYKRPKQFEIRSEEFEKTSTKKVKRFLYKQKPISVSG